MLRGVELRTSQCVRPEASAVNHDQFPRRDWATQTAGGIHHVSDEFLLRQEAIYYEPVGKRGRVYLAIGDCGRGELGQISQAITARVHVAVPELLREVARRERMQNSGPVVVAFGR